MAAFETVHRVPAAAIISAATALLVAKERIELLHGGDESTLSDDLATAAGELLQAAAGVDGSLTSAEFWTHPLVVEANARANERMAEYLVGYLERWNYADRAREIRERHHAAWDAFQPIGGGGDG